jgi:hypothetical protein
MPYKRKYSGDIARFLLKLPIQDRKRIIDQFDALLEGIPKGAYPIEANDGLWRWDFWQVYILFKVHHEQQTIKIVWIDWRMRRL